MRIAALVVSRNRPDLVESTIQQLGRSSLPLDTYVVESGTDDDKVSPHATIRYADPDFRGKCYAHNVALSLARLEYDYDYFWVLMNDLVFPDGVDPVATLVETMEREPRLAVLSPTNEDGEYPGCARRAAGGWRPVTTCDYLALMIRGAAVEEVGFLNGAFRYSWGAIHEYAYKLYEAGWLVGYSDDVTYRHLGGTTYGAAGTNTISRDDYQTRAAAFAAEYMALEYGADWDERFWLAAAGHGIETNTFSLHRRAWEQLGSAPEDAEPEKAAPAAPERVCVQLGSGGEYRAGWINVDTDPACNPDIVASVESLPMLESGSVDLVEGCHLFEHLTLHQARSALAEWHRILRPGGELYLELPDLGASVAMLGQHFDGGGYDLGMIGIYGWPPDIEAHGAPMQHKWGWTRTTIAQELAATGFGETEFVATTQTWRPADQLGRNMRVRALKRNGLPAPAEGRVAGATNGASGPRARTNGSVPHTNGNGAEANGGGAHPFTTLAFVDELAADPDRLVAYVGRFGQHDEATLAIYAPELDPAEALARLEPALAAARVREETSAKVTLLAPGRGANLDQQLADSVDALYSDQRVGEPFCWVSRYGLDQLDGLRRLYDSETGGDSEAGGRNFLLLTYDSCRYDVLCDAHTPVLDSYATIARAVSPASYTYAAHQSFFVGILPNAEESVPYFNRFTKQLFKLSAVGENLRKAYATVESDYNIVAGLRARGYQTVGAGAMNWFKQTSLTSAFEQFAFTGTDADAQIEYLRGHVDPARPFFGFINFGETHDPFDYRGKPEPCPVVVQARAMTWPPVADGPVGREHPAYRHQVEAAEFLDSQLPRLFDGLPGNTVVVLCGDHGECFGEDGYFGHAINHPKVYEVPLAIFRLDGQPL